MTTPLEQAKREGERFGDVSARFWSHVRKGEGDACWEWTGAKHSKGYGSFWLPGRKTVRSHRWAFEQEHGTIPKGLILCHRCDNPSCVRPSHLYAGTHRDNMRDAVTSGLTRWTHTLCQRGHEFTAENTIRTSQGRRLCRICNKALEQRKQQRRTRSQAA